MSVVQKKEFSKNGVPKFQVDGHWYFIEREVQTQGLEPGASINFKWREFGEDRGRGRPRTITSWAPAAQQASRSSNGPSASPSVISDVDVLRSVSNVVGSACAAGTVKTPEELQEWFVAAWAGLQRKPYPKGLGKTTEDDYVDSQRQSPSEPEFDDDIPF